LGSSSASHQARPGCRQGESTPARSNNLAAPEGDEHGAQPGIDCRPASAPAQDPPHQPSGNAPSRATTEQVAGLPCQRKQQPLLLAGGGGGGPGGVAFLGALLRPLEALLLGRFLLRQGFGLLGRFGLPLGGFGGGGGLGGPLEQQLIVSVHIY
jgi:hypothetical protein